MNQDIISISMENTKMGPIPSFSLPPGISCNQDAPCLKCGCYAKRMYRMRRNVRASWNQNWYMVNKRIDDWTRQMNGWLAIYQPRAFRIHVSGDFFCCRYLDQWCKIAAANPKVKFFAFTKQWNVIRSVGCFIPKNLSIILSAWMPEKNNWCPPEDLMKKYPVAWMLRNGCYSTSLETIWEVQKMVHGHDKTNIIPCEGHCATCGKCFKLKKKDGDILFEYH